MSDTSVELEAEYLLKIQAELNQLRFEVKWLREANKGLSEALEKARRTRGAGVV